MPDRPISMVEPQIGALVADRFTLLRRIGHTAERIRAGDRLWLREPFHLPRQWGRTAPTTAIARGARPVFVTDLPPAASRSPEVHADLGIGPRRNARDLPRVAHRQHLLVTGVSRALLQRITEDEARAEGFPTRSAWAAHWDLNLSFASSRAGCSWRDNPEIVVIEFTRIAEPLP